MDKVGLFFRLLPILLALAGIAGVASKGCQEGPFGRTQVVGLNETQENALGSESYNQVLSKSRINKDPLVNDAVKRIARRLAGAADQPELAKRIGIKPRLFEWDYKVIESTQVNAFCLPGGKVAVYTGIIPVAKTEAGLAVVLGHEIGHALARHGAERMAHSQMLNMGQMGVASSIGDLSASSQQIVMGMLGAGSEFGLMLPFSRKHESEADHIGLLLMASAGYDPNEAGKFWERMMKATGGKNGPTFASTHPGPETRIHDLQKWTEEEAREFYQRSDKQESKDLPVVR